MNSKDTTLAEKLTTPIGRGLLSAGTTAGGLLLANKALGTQRAAKLFARIGKKPTPISGRNVAGAAIGSGLLSGVFAKPERSMYAASLADKIERGGKFTNTEKRLFGLKSSATRSAPKTLSEHYFSPSSMGGFRSVLGGVMGGFSPLAFTEGAATGVLGTVGSAELMARALKSRLKGGRKLNKREQRLAAMLRATKNA